MLQRFTAESSPELSANNKQRQVSMFLILLFKLLTQFPFVSFLFFSHLYPLSVLSLLPLPHPFFLFWSIVCLPKIKTSNFITFCFTNGTFFCILFHTMNFFNNAFYKLVETKFWCLSSNLSYPEDLKKQWLHCRVGSRNSNKGGSLRPSSSYCLFVSFSIPSLLPFSILSLLPSPFPLASLPPLHAIWSIVCPKINTSCSFQLVYLAKRH